MSRDGLPDITPERRAELRRIDDAVAAGALAHATEAYNMALRNRRRTFLIFLLAGVLYTLGFYLQGEQSARIHRNQAESCQVQRTNTDALHALSDVLRAAGVGSSTSRSVAVARHDFILHVQDIPRDTPTRRALRDLADLLRGTQRQEEARRQDPDALARAADSFRKIARNAKHPLSCAGS